MSLCSHLGLFEPCVFGSSSSSSSGTLEFWPSHLQGWYAVFLAELVRVAPIAKPLDDPHYLDMMQFVEGRLEQRCDVLQGNGSKGRDVPALCVSALLQPVSQEAALLQPVSQEAALLQPVSQEAIIRAVDTGLSASVVELLLVAGFSPHSTATSGHSLLCLASQSGFSDLVRLLIQWKADVNYSPGSSNQAVHCSPVFLAACNGRSSALELLLRGGACPTADALAAARGGDCAGCVELLEEALGLSEKNETKSACKE
jgi:hypothetical protein